MHRWRAGSFQSSSMLAADEDWTICQYILIKLMKVLGAQTATMGPKLIWWPASLLKSYSFGRMRHRLANLFLWKEQQGVYELVQIAEIHRYWSTHVETWSNKMICKMGAVLVSVAHVLVSGRSRRPSKIFKFAEKWELVWESHRTWLWSKLADTLSFDFAS